MQENSSGMIDVGNLSFAGREAYSQFRAIIKQGENCSVAESAFKKLIDDSKKQKVTFHSAQNNPPGGSRMLCESGEALVQLPSTSQTSLSDLVGHMQHVLTYRENSWRYGSLVRRKSLIYGDGSAREIFKRFEAPLREQTYKRKMLFGAGYPMSDDSKFELVHGKPREASFSEWIEEKGKNENGKYFYVQHNEEGGGRIRFSFEQLNDQGRAVIEEAMRCKRDIQIAYEYQTDEKGKKIPLDKKSVIAWGPRVEREAEDVTMRGVLSFDAQAKEYVCTPLEGEAYRLRADIACKQLSDEYLETLIKRGEEVDLKVADGNILCMPRMENAGERMDAALKSPDGNPSYKLQAPLAYKNDPQFIAGDIKKALQICAEANPEVVHAYESIKKKNVALTIDVNEEGENYVEKNGKNNDVTIHWDRTGVGTYPGKEATRSIAKMWHQEVIGKTPPLPDFKDLEYDDEGLSLGDVFSQERKEQKEARIKKYQQDISDYEAKAQITDEQLNVYEKKIRLGSDATPIVLLGGLVCEAARCVDLHPSLTRKSTSFIPPVTVATEYAAFNYERQTSQALDSCYTLYATGAESTWYPHALGKRYLSSLEKHEPFRAKDATNKIVAEVDSSAHAEQSRLTVPQRIAGLEIMESPIPSYDGKSIPSKEPAVLSQQQVPYLTQFVTGKCFVSTDGVNFSQIHQPKIDGIPQGYANDCRTGETTNQMLVLRNHETGQSHFFLGAGVTNLQKADDEIFGYPLNLVQEAAKGGKTLAAELPRSGWNKGEVHVEEGGQIMQR